MEAWVKGVCMMFIMRLSESRETLFPQATHERQGFRSYGTWEYIQLHTFNSFTL